MQDFIRKVEVVSKRTIREKPPENLSIQARLQDSRYFALPFGRVALAEHLCVDRSVRTRELAKMKADRLDRLQQERFPNFVIMALLFWKQDH